LAPNIAILLASFLDLQAAQKLGRDGVVRVTSRSGHPRISQESQLMAHLPV
jgi:hypothetical protein